MKDDEEIEILLGKLKKADPGKDYGLSEAAVDIMRTVRSSWKLAG